MMVVPTSKYIFEVFREKSLAKQTFKKVEKRDSVYIIQDKKIQYKYNRIKKPSYVNGISRNRIAVLFKAVKKAYNDYIIKNSCDIDIPEKMGAVRGTNPELYQSLKVGEIFYHIDASHCYWRTAYLIGMLPENIYNRYANDKDMKRLRNMSLTAVLAPKTCEFVVNGNFAGRITEDTEIYNSVYTKIRTISYNLIFEALQKIGNDWILYNVDGICLLPVALETVKAMFTESGYPYTVSECHKLSEDQYEQGGEIKNFVRKIVNKKVA